MAGENEKKQTAYEVLQETRSERADVNLVNAYALAAIAEELHGLNERIDKMTDVEGRLRFLQWDGHIM